MKIVRAIRAVSKPIDLKYGNVAELIETLKVIRLDCVKVLNGEVEFCGKPVELDMRAWVRKADKTCYVCLAGTQLIKEGKRLPSSSEHWDFYDWLDSIRHFTLNNPYTWRIFDFPLAARLARRMPGERLGIYRAEDVLRGLDRLIELLEKV